MDKENELFVVEIRVNGVLVAMSDPFGKDDSSFEEAHNQARDRSTYGPYLFKHVPDPFEKKDSWIQRIARKVFGLTEEKDSDIPLVDINVCPFRKVHIRPKNRMYMEIGMCGEEGQLRQPLTQMKVDVTVSPHDFKMYGEGNVLVEAVVSRMLTHILGELTDAGRHEKLTRKLAKTMK